MKAFFLTSLLLLVTFLQTMGQPMPEIKAQITVKPSEEPKTISDMVGEIREIMKELKLQFHPGTKDEDIIFGLQHTVADQRQPDSEKGKPFPVTTEYFPKIVNYYRTAVAAIKDNKSDMEILPLFVDALQDMSISRQESRFIMDNIELIQNNNKLNSRGIVNLENRDTNRNSNVPGLDNKSEVDKDPRLLAKDPDGMNEGIAFKMDGKERIFMKQYLASLLEPICESTAVGQNQDANKSLPIGQVSNSPSLVKINN